MAIKSVSSLVDIPHAVLEATFTNHHRPGDLEKVDYELFNAGTHGNESTEVKKMIGAFQGQPSLKYQNL